MRYVGLLLAIAGCSSAAGALHGADVVPAAEGGATADDGGRLSDASAPSEASSPEASATSCTRAAQAKTAPTSLYDALVADLASLTSTPDRQVRADRFLADVEAAGGTPLAGPAGDDRVVFLAKGAPPNGTWSVGGSFGGTSDWKASAIALTNVADTDLYAVDTHVPRGRSHVYKLLSGATDAGFVEDLRAHNVAWDGIDHKAPGQFNAVVHPEESDATKGRVEAHRAVRATGLGDTRDVFVYLPAAYDDGSCAPLPHVVFHDGNESLTRGDFAGVADTEYTAHPDESAVLVFVALPTQGVRTDEYTFGTPTALADAYGRFLLDDLEPSLARDYRLCGAIARDRGIAGASLGGLVSTYLAFQRPDAWGYVGAQSASYFWNGSAMISRASDGPKVDVRFYVDHGCPGPEPSTDNCDVDRQMNDALVARGYEVRHVEVDPAQHDWPYWAARLPQLLAYFREGSGKSCH